jgi:hypothetical protein
MVDPSYKKTVPQMREHLKKVLGFVPEAIVKEYAEGRKQAKTRASIIKLTQVHGNSKEAVEAAIKVCKEELKGEMFKKRGICKKCRQSALAKRLTELEGILTTYNK